MTPLDHELDEDLGLMTPLKERAKLRRKRASAPSRCALNISTMDPSAHAPSMI